MAGDIVIQRELL